MRLSARSITFVWLLLVGYVGTHEDAMAGAPNRAASTPDYPSRPVRLIEPRRSTLLPEVPTIAEAGVAGFDFPIWYRVWAPAGTPAQAVDKLAKDIARALPAPDLRDWLVKHGGRADEHDAARVRAIRAKRE